MVRRRTICLTVMPFSFRRFSPSPLDRGESGSYLKVLENLKLRDYPRVLYALRDEGKATWPVEQSNVMGTRTKKDLIKEVANRTGLDILTVKDNIQCMFDTMCEGLGRDGNIEIRNFGIFKLKPIPSRTARNPKTGETIEVPAKNLIHFKPGQLMKQRINNYPVRTPPPVRVETPQPALPVETPPEQTQKDQRPKRLKPVSGDKTQPAIILLSRPVND